MKLFSHLKTSEKISLSFTLMSFFSIFVFLLLINISYFFIWYTGQQEMVFSSMNETYKNYLTADGKMEEVEAFKSYLLTKDTLIIPEIGDPVCSPGVAKKVRMEVGQMQESFFYRDGDIIYVVYSQYFPSIGNVKVFFDTTSYITSQIIILKVGLLFLCIITFFQFFIGKIISRSLLRDLKNIAQSLQNVNIHHTKKHIICNLAKHDEIRILADALNLSSDTIDIQTQKLKQFLTDVSHEFKTPLMVMLSKLDVLEKRMQKKSFTQTDITQFYEISRYNIKKMNGLIEALFLLSQNENTSQHIQKKQYDMEQYLQTKKQRYAQYYTLAPDAIKLEVEAGLMYEIDEQSFSILLDNLVQNAIKFSLHPHHITLTATTKSLSVTDTGMGIPEEEISKIFQKFYRRDTNIEGFGIGLSLVTRIAEMYGWRIEVESKVGKGSTFTIYM